jgi:hypothetical protein
VGDRTSGVRGCKTVGSRMVSATKLSDFVLNRLCSKKDVKVKILKGNKLLWKRRGLLKGIMTY